MQSFQLQERGTSVQATSYQVEDWQGGYKSLQKEFDYFIDDVEGQIPAELEGTLFRNGPGLLDVNGQRLHHPFDGDGMISRFTFQNGRAHFRNRFIRTKGFVEEQASGKILYRGVFGTQKPGGPLANAFDLKLKNIANTNVIYWGGKLLALWEAAEPHKLDPNTLETLGMEYLDGVLEPGDAFAAHPKIDPSSDRNTSCLVNFAIKPGISSKIFIYELDTTGKVVRCQRQSVPGFAFIHDFAITPNYCIFFQNPVTFNPVPFVLGLRGAGECVQFNPKQPTRIIIIPRQGADEISQSKMQILETQSGFVFHHANAFEQDDNIYIDSICYESLPAVESGEDYRQVEFDALSPGQLWRFKLNLNDKIVQRELLESRCSEFPSLHPAKVGRSHRYLYMGAADGASGNAPLQAILKLDLESGTKQLWSAAPQGFVSEPVFVPRPNATNEDDGWVIALVYDSSHHRSDVIILDARNFMPPVARLHLKHHIPYGLHGNWTPECFTTNS